MLQSASLRTSFVQSGFKKFLNFIFLLEIFLEVLVDEAILAYDFPVIFQSIIDVVNEYQHYLSDDLKTLVLTSSETKLG